MRKFLSMLMVLAMIFSLAACKNKDETPPTDAKGQTVTATTAGSVGSVLVIGENYLTVYYYEDGKVISIADSDGNAAYPELKD